MENKISVIGIAKRLEELFYPNDPIPLYLDKKSETLKIIQQLYSTYMVMEEPRALMTLPSITFPIKLTYLDHNVP